MVIRMDTAHTMEFRILGPLEVSSGERRLALQGGAQRALLAALLLHANRPVSVERLIDELWGPDAGRGAVKRLQVAISRLRRVLAAASVDQRGDDVLATEAGGYQLRVAPGALDADRFYRLVAEGRCALEADRCQTAAETLRTALSLWRGPALSDVSYEAFAQVEIARL